MKNWTIRKRILCGFAVLLTLFAVLGVSSIVLLKLVRQNVHVIVDDAVPGITIAGKIKFNSSEAHQAVWRHIFSATAEDKARFEEKLAKFVEANDKLMNEYAASIITEEDRQLHEALKLARVEYAKGRARMLELSRANAKLEEVYAFNKASWHPAHDALDLATDRLFDRNEKLGREAGEETAQELALASRITLIVSAAGIVLGITFATVIIIGLGRVLRTVAMSLEEGATQLASASSQVSATSQTLAEGASEQAASIEETSSSLEEMSSMTRRNAENASQANGLSRETRGAADRGVADMQAMSSAMQAIKVSSDDIAKIIKTIDEIAFQTNILALNAAVEAARAGEAGMGFAVVADEVRNLAQRSAQAAKETAAKIEGAITKTAQGVDLSDKVAKTLNDIVAKARQVDELAAEVAGASREQSQGVTQINAAVNQMDKVTQSNAASAEEIAASAEELNAQAATMKSSVAQLLALVGGEAGGSARTAAAATALPPRRTTDFKPGSSGRANGAAVSVPTGRSPALAAAAAAPARSEIPMDGEFKSF